MWSVSTRRWAAAAARAGPRHARASALVSGFSSSSDSKVAEQAKKWQQQKPEDKAKFLSVQVDRSALKQPGGALGQRARGPSAGQDEGELAGARAALHD